MCFSAVIFDLDGTMLNTLGDIADSANRVLKELNLSTHNADSYRHFIGNGVEMLMKRALPEGRRDEATLKSSTQAFRRIYSRHWNIHTKPYDGAIDVLNELANRHIKLAVLSNKPDDLAKVCVREFFPDCVFDMVLGHHSDRPPKPHPAGAVRIAEVIGVSPSKILFVGDSAVDMETAISAGMYPVGALWGFRSLEELRDKGAKVLIKHPLDILPLVDK